MNPLDWLAALNQWVAEPAVAPWIVAGMVPVILVRLHWRRWVRWGRP